MCIGGGHPNDTNHTRSRSVFEITKVTKNSSSILKTLNALDIAVQDKDSLSYLKEVSQKGLFALEGLPEIKLKTQYYETDAKFEGTDVLVNGTIRVNESIEGTGLSESFVIGQRDEFRGHERSIYWTQIQAGGGNDVIVGNHSGRQPSSKIEVWGEEGVDQFVSTQRDGTMFSIEDMEHGETFTTHQDYDQVEMIRQFNNGEKLFHVGSSSNPNSPRHMMIVEADSTMLHALDSEGNNLYICVPEM